MSQLKFKKDLLPLLLKFIVTRILIILIGAICFVLFTARNPAPQAGSAIFITNHNGIWDHFDSHWYQKLAEQGYPKRPFTNNVQETWGFMPLYPICIKTLTLIAHINTFYAGIIISNVCTLLALICLYKLAQQKFDTGAQTIAFILSCTGSFYLSIVYTEGLFLLLTSLVFYLSHKQKYGWALIIAGLASVTRIQGCLLFSIPVIEIITQQVKISYKYIPALILSLLPMAAFMLYLQQTCGEPLAFLKIQHAWGSADLYPLQGFFSLLNGHAPWSSVFNTFFWILIIFVVLSSYKKLPLSYTIFTVLYFLLSTSNEIVYGTTRYMLGLIPLFIAISLSSTNVKYLFLLINVLFLAITICAFVTNTPNFI